MERKSNASMIIRELKKSNLPWFSGIKCLREKPWERIPGIESSLKNQMWEAVEFSMTGVGIAGPANCTEEKSDTRERGFSKLEGQCLHILFSPLCHCHKIRHMDIMDI